ncbi:hypothetical protein K04M5_35660 [Vibrio alginolyticus]|nr:hypothetical protein K04M5_35660 [Vibrio alginolyticus]
MNDFEKELEQISQETAQEPEVKTAVARRAKSDRR